MTGHSPSQPKTADDPAENVRKGLAMSAAGYEFSAELLDVAELLDAYDALRAKVDELTAENFALAANQCHAGYGDDYGNHRCEKIDALKDALLGLIEAVELDSDKGGKGISGYTAARLTDARAVIAPSVNSQGDAK